MGEEADSLDPSLAGKILHEFSLAPSCATHCSERGGKQAKNYVEFKRD